jgi:HEAT repeat protein
VTGAAESLGEHVAEAEATILARLGIRPDPERSLEIGFADDLHRTGIETMVRAGRRVVEVRLPAAPVARELVAPGALVTDAVCRAALSEELFARLPDWYRTGAPLWVSGGLERAIREAVLGGPLVRTDAGRIVPRPGPFEGRADPLSAGLALRFLAEEFGADRVRDLFEAFRRAADPAEGLRAALGTDPDSLPVAFDSFCLRVLSELTDDRIVRELAAAQSEAPRERATRLSGLASRTADPWVAAAVEEELALALFEAGEFRDASEMLARIEREHAAHALHFDRDRLHFALCFARTGEPEAAALRLDAFLTEFPGSTLRPAAEYEQAGILLDLGRVQEAAALYRRIAAGGPFSAPAHRVLAAFERGRFHYGAARTHLLALRGDPEAARALAEIEAELADGLPEGGRRALETALSAAARGSDEEAVETIRGVGPAGTPVLTGSLAAGPPPEVRRAILAAVRQWPRGECEVLLFRLLADPEPDVAAGALTSLLDAGVAPADLRALLDRHPDPVPHALAEWERRFKSAPDRPDVASGVHSESAVARREAARQLADIPGPESLAALLELAGDEAAPVRAAAAESLSTRSEPEAVEAVRIALGDDSRAVRLAAAGALFSRGDLEPLRERAIGDPDPQVRLATARYLLAAGREEDIPRVVGLLHDTDGAVAAAAEALLRGAAGPKVLRAAGPALVAAPDAGSAMRIVRVIAAHTGSDFGYDPTGGPSERERVARSLAARLAEPSSAE